jgi:hypothetical protein
MESKAMGSMFTKKPRLSPLNLVTLPACCVPSGESESLVEKREAKLQWMHEKGLKYLGDPLKRIEKRPAPTPVPMRIVGVRALTEAAGVRAAAREA